MSSPDETRSALPSMPRWLKIGLIASVALNLLILGTFASAYLQSSWSDWPMRGGFTRSVVSYLPELPVDKQNTIKPLIDATQQAMRPLRQNLREQRRTLHAVLQAETFDKAAFEAEMLKLLRAEAELRKAARLPLGEIMSKLTQTERRELMQWHADRRQHRRNRRTKANQENLATPSTKPSP